MLLYRLSTLIGCLALAQGYAFYRDSIPNGYNLLNPCTPGEVWQGVGHLSPFGGGARNQFGKDFLDNGKNWLNICNLDSDKDGLTNGQELGDPQCVWTPGSTPARTTGLSHPGFCQPVNSTECENSEHKLTCEGSQFAGSRFECPAINEPGVQSLVLTFPRTAVPNTVTNYMCMTFDLDQSQDYHLIATKGETDNLNVIHHMLLYGCVDGAEAIQSPISCDMYGEKCREVIGMWTVGLAGQCMYKEAGFRIGKTSFKRVLLQLHWNNPELRSDYYDASGMTIYFTPNLRPHDAGNFYTGETYLEIPPNRNRVVFESVCPSECTRDMFNGPVFFTQGINHMHYKGIAETVELFSNGQRTYLTNEQEYNYDSPMTFVFDTPIKMHPGDSLKTTCVYRTLGATKTTFYGLATSDEMCFSALTYYPKEAISQNTCTSYMGFQQCKMKNGYYGDCHVDAFFNASIPATKEVIDKVLDKCNIVGGCRAECPAAIEEAKRHPCLRGDSMKWVLPFTSGSPSIEHVKFAGAMSSCPMEDCSWPHTSSATKTLSSLLSIAMLTVIGHVFY